MEVFLASASHTPSPTRAPQSNSGERTKKLTPHQTSEKNFTLGDAEANSRPNQAEIKKSSRAESLVRASGA
jgi:hypothetical protein